VGATLAAAQPMRQWVAARWRALVADTATESALPTARAGNGTTAPATGVGLAVAFAPSGGGFTLRFVGVPARGTLTVVVAAVRDARLTVADVGTLERAPALLVLPDGVRVEVTDTAAVRYGLVLPAIAPTTRLRLRVASRDTLLVLAMGDSLTLPLARGAPGTR
jgi:hypothetical protein